ncbi:MAG: hypothetical protein AAF683_03760 [Pseudomonadota bacterium]
MIKNGKFFVAPQQTDDDFKRLFARLAAVGAGRPVDRDGLPDGPWTPDELADAISRIEANTQGIELRSVQVWFHDNDNGISDTNIRWLARIFGCSDPEATGQWQAELKAAKERLTSQRREKKKKRGKEKNDYDLNEATRPSIAKQIGGQTQRCRGEFTKDRRFEPVKLAERCERMLSGATSLNLQIGYLLVFCGLGLMNYVLGTLNVTYSPLEGLDKQVGFIWAPTLTLLPLIALPAYIFFVSNVITYWRRAGRLRCLSDRSSTIEPRSTMVWYGKVNSFSFSFWAITISCISFVFGFQWFGIYLPAYLSGDHNGVQIDRYLLALVRPDVISIPEAIALSAVGYMYTASYVAVFMFGLLFILIITLDYEDVSKTTEREGPVEHRSELYEVGQMIRWGIFRVAVFALWLAILVKLQITYLQSDSRDVVTWMFVDAAAAFSATMAPNGWLDNSSVSHFTTFLMMAVTVVVFVLCIGKMSAILNRLVVEDSLGSFDEDKSAVVTMFLIIGLLSANLILIGRFTGFSIMLALGALATAYALAGPKLRTS